MKELKFRFYDLCNDVMIYSDDFPNLASFFSIYQATVDGEDDPVLMQYTGVNDINGKEIYTGDIIKDSVFKFEVIFGKECGCFGGQGIRDFWLFAEFLDRHEFDFKVIGNRYENKSLLEEIE